MSFRFLHPSAVIYRGTSRHVQPNFVRRTRCRHSRNYDQLHIVYSMYMQDMIYMSILLMPAETG